MKLAFWQRLAVLTVLGLGASSFNSVLAAQFEQQEIDQSRFIVLAAPGGDIGYKLLILEQLNNKRPCWSETGSSPSNVDPLLLSFDFTGICNRLVDSNSFSVRTAGEDQGLQYSLRILRRDNDLVLVAASNTDRNTQIEIGRTYGLPNGFSRIVLDPGWRLTRRTYNGRTLGHVYLTYDQPIEVLIASARNNVPLGGQLPAPATTPFPSTVPSTETSSEPAPDSTLPAASSDSTNSTEVIPVPSLPPAVLLPAPLPSGLSPRRSGTAPNLSTILPRPSTSTQTSSQAEAAPESSATLPPPPIPTLDDSATSTNGMPQSPSQTTPPTATGDLPTTVESNSPPASQSSTSSQTPSNPTRPNLASSSRTSSTASRLPIGETYQVVVVADNAETQDKVRAIAPSAFLTTINGQVVMQVGVFRDRQQADQLQQRFSLEGLPTAVIPVR